MAPRVQSKRVVSKLDSLIRPISGIEEKWCFCLFLLYLMIFEGGDLK